MLIGTAGSARRLLAANLAAGRRKAADCSTRSLATQEQDPDCCGCCEEEEEAPRDLCPKRCPPGPRGCPGDPVPFRDHCCKDPMPPPCCVCPHSTEETARGCQECKLPQAPAPICPRPQHHRGPGDGSPSPYAKWIIAAVGGAAAIGLAAYAASSLAGAKEPPQDACEEDVPAFDPCDPCGCDTRSKSGKG